MKVGVTVRNFGGFAPEEGGIRACLELARRAELLGFDSVWVTDHLVLPAQFRTRYPYNSTGIFPFAWDDDIHEPLVLMSALAQVTERAEIGVAVLVIPYRHPLMVAKMLATTDQIAGGRIILGAGVGWLQEEFDALGLPAEHFTHRGAVTDDYLRAMKDAWLNTGPSRYTGDYVRFRDVGTFPHPVRSPHIPIWAGGKGTAARMRAVRLGNGYVAVAAEPEALRTEVLELLRLAEADHRDPSEVTVALLAGITLTRTPAPRDRASLTGTPEQIIEDLQRYEEAGLQHLIAGLTREGDVSLPATLAAMETVAVEILPWVQHRGIA